MSTLMANFLKSFQPLTTTPKADKNPQTVLHHKAHHHAGSCDQESQGVQQGVKPLELEIPLTVTPPLTMIEGIQGFQILQEIRVQILRSGFEERAIQRHGRGNHDLVRQHRDVSCVFSFSLSLRGLCRGRSCRRFQGRLWRWVTGKGPQFRLGGNFGWLGFESFCVGSMRLLHAEFKFKLRAKSIG